MLAQVTETFEAIPGLLIAIALIPVCGIAVLMVLKWMFSGELDTGPGIVAIAVVVLIPVVTVMSKSEYVAGAVIVIMITLMMFFPYALDQLDSAEVRGMDIDKLDKAHRQITETPENVPTYFLLAELVHSLGLEGHAVSIAEQTLDRLSTKIDPIKNQSIREAFRAEESKAREWRRRITDPGAFRAVACPRCRKMNESGAIACGNCQGPFLLDLARAIDPRPKVRSKLVLSWALVAGFFTGTVYGWMLLDGFLRIALLLTGLGLVGGTMHRLFRDRTLRD